MLFIRAQLYNEKHSRLRKNPVSADSPSAPIAALYQEHHRWLQGWLRSRLGCSETAADLAHDTFLRLLLKPVEPGFLPALREPRAYLTTVAKRLLIDHQRRRSLELAWAETLALLPEDVAPSPEDQLMILQALHEIDALLNALPAAVRSVFLLSQVEGLKYAEIAQRLAISERTVKRYMVQAFECVVLGP